MSLSSLFSVFAWWGWCNTTVKTQTSEVSHKSILSRRLIDSSLREVSFTASNWAEWGKSFFFLHAQICLFLLGDVTLQEMFHSLDWNIQFESPLWSQYPDQEEVQEKVVALHVARCRWLKDWKVMNKKKFFLYRAGGWLLRTISTNRWSDSIETNQINSQTDCNLIWEKTEKLNESETDSSAKVFHLQDWTLRLNGFSSESALQCFQTFTPLALCLPFGDTLAEIWGDSTFSYIVNMEWNAWLSPARVTHTHWNGGSFSCKLINVKLFYGSMASPSQHVKKKKKKWKVI